MKEIIFNKTIKIFSYKVKFEKQSKNGLGRFGGGWQVEFGFQKGRTSLILNLFVMSIRINKLK